VGENAEPELAVFDQEGLAVEIDGDGPSDLFELS
jgi:hypothetical protein